MGRPSGGAQRRPDVAEEHSLRLERLGRAHRQALLGMAAEFRAEGDARFALLLEDADAFFRQVERFAVGRRLPPDRVPQTWFLLFRGERLLGGSRLRHRLIPTLHRDGGHIGYEIRRSERGKGYGTALLALTLEQARRSRARSEAKPSEGGPPRGQARSLGLERVLLTTERTNQASIRLIERNGGIPGGSSVSPHTGEVMLRYWISLA